MLIRADNARKLAQDQIREKIEMVLIEKEKVHDLEQTLQTLGKELMKAQQTKIELESQIKSESSGKLRISYDKVQEAMMAEDNPLR